MEPSMKDQAQEIMVAVDRDLQKVETKAPVTQEQVGEEASALMRMLFGVVNKVDVEAAAERVQAMRAKYPKATPEELSQRLIREKCQRTGTVGAVTSGAGLIPGIGTAAALTLGVAADIGATFKLQAELVLEIAAVYDYPLTEQEKQQLVLVITGLSTGTSTLARKAGERMALELSEKFAEKAFMKALPIVGVIASAGTNALATYIIGQRADAYFRLGPDAMESWTDSVRKITGVDERQIGTWLAESGKVTGAALVSGAEKVGEAGKVAGDAVVSGAKKAGETAQTGVKAYFRWLITFWTAVFRLIGWVLGFIWNIIAFIPRKIIGLFQRKGKASEN